MSMAGDNPTALNLPFIADIVRENLGDSLTDPASGNPEQVPFTVEEGDTASTIAERLEDEDLVKDRRAFVLIATERELTGELKSGDFVLRRNMTPDEVVTALLAPPADGRRKQNASRFVRSLRERGDRNDEIRMTNDEGMPK